MKMVCNKTRIGIFPIFWGHARKESNMIFFTSQVETQQEKKKKPSINQLTRFCIFYRSFSAHSIKEKSHQESIKGKKTVSDQRESKTNQIQGNENKSSLNSHVVRKAAHEEPIQSGNMAKRGKDHWFKKKKGVFEKKEGKNNYFQGNRKESSGSVDSHVVGKSTHENHIKGGNVEKRGKGHWFKKKKGVWDQKKTKTNQIQHDRKESTLFGIKKRTPPVASQVNQAQVTKQVNQEQGAKQANPGQVTKQVRPEKVAKQVNQEQGAKQANHGQVTRQIKQGELVIDGKPTYQRQIRGGNVKQNKNDFRSRKKKLAYQKPSQAQKLEESQNYFTYEKKKLDNQSYIKNQNLQRKDKNSHNAPDHQKQIKTSNLKRNKKKSIKDHYITRINDRLGKKSKLCYIFVNKGIKILHKTSCKSIELQQMMHKKWLKAKPVIHKTTPKGKVIYRLGHQKLKRGASYQILPKGIINRWLSIEVKPSNKIKTKGNKRLHQSSPTSKDLHRVAHKNLIKNSNFQARYYKPYFKYLLQEIPQTFSNYKMVDKVKKMWSMGERIVIISQKLLQQQNKRIQDLQRKVVDLDNEKETELLQQQNKGTQDRQRKVVDLDNEKETQEDREDREIKFIKKFRNMLMRDGKASKAYTTLFKSLKLFRTYIEKMSVQEEFIQKLAETESSNYIVHCLQQAVENIKPCLEVRKKKISGIIRQIPAMPSKKRQEKVSIRWIIESARKRKKKTSKPFFHCLAEEFLDAYKKQGEPYRRKKALYDIAEANRIYIRYRWW